MSELRPIDRIAKKRAQQQLRPIDRIAQKRAQPPIDRIAQQPEQPPIDRIAQQPEQPPINPTEPQRTEKQGLKIRPIDRIAKERKERLGLTQPEVQQQLNDLREQRVTTTPQPSQEWSKKKPESKKISFESMDLGEFDFDSYREDTPAITLDAFMETEKGGERIPNREKLEQLIFDTIVKKTDFSQIEEASKPYVRSTLENLIDASYQEDDASLIDLRERLEEGLTSLGVETPLINTDEIENDTIDEIAPENLEFLGYGDLRDESDREVLEPIRTSPEVASVRTADGGHERLNSNVTHKKEIVSKTVEDSLNRAQEEVDARLERGASLENVLANLENDFEEVNMDLELEGVNPSDYNQEEITNMQNKRDRLAKQIEYVNILLAKQAAEKLAN